MRQMRMDEINISNLEQNIYKTAIRVIDTSDVIVSFDQPQV